MEQRLIDADALKVSYCKQCLKETGNEQIEVKQTPYCAIACQDFDVIDKQPTVDAVPVEWIKNHIREQVECDNRTYAMKIKAMLDWYMLKCADGERKEQERE